LLISTLSRILNLFSRDTYVVDQILARVIQGLCRTVAVCLSILVVIGSSFPPFLIVVFPLGWFYLRVMKCVFSFPLPSSLSNVFTPRYYLATSRELKRLDAVSRSPIFAWFSESLAGLSTIRAFRQQPVFAAINHDRIDRNQVCYLPSISVNRWLAVRLEFVGALIIFTVTLLSMTALIMTGVDAGLVGLVLSYALNTTSSLVRVDPFYWTLAHAHRRTGSCVRRAKLSRTLSAWSGSSIRPKSSPKHHTTQST
jgi:ABC-type multidrug transport system fused ATPase/permease subunit